MIDLAIAKFHGENVSRLTKIDERLIGIDGNGSGRKGVLQKHGEQLEEMNGDIKTLLTRSENFSKKGVWAVVKWGIPTIITLLALLLSYYGYRVANNKSIAIVPVIRETIPAEASN